MSCTPNDILNYILDHELEYKFISAVTLQTDNYSIAEIPDKRIVPVKDSYRLKSVMYKLNVPVTDDDIITATLNQLYVSAFLSRHHDDFRVHFLVHRYPVSMKTQFDEEITKEVIRYIILQTIVTLKLNTIEKVNAYMGVA